MSGQVKIGISSMAGRVAPVFDVSRRLLVVDAENGRPATRQDVGVDAPDAFARVRQLRSLGVEVLVCGAISRPLEALVRGAGVHVVPHTCGPVEEVLAALLDDRLPEQAFLMPGCRGRRRGGRRRGRRGRRRRDAPGVKATDNQPERW